MNATDKKQVDFARGLENTLRVFSRPFMEIYKGIATGSLPWEYCLGSTFFVQICLAFRLDRNVLSKLGFAFLYPKTHGFYLFYYLLWIAAPFIAWGVVRAAIASRLKRHLTSVFKNIGLQNRMGKLPNLIFDTPLDQATRKLRLSKASLSMDEFQRHKASLESALHVYVDEMREDRAKGTVDIIYSHSPMPENFTLKTYENYHKWEFTVGTTRSKTVRSTLTQVPHLLVAGQTGGGKSTFLRHMITGLFLSDKNTKFTLIDLKGGLEFQLFENIERIQVTGEMGSAVELLKSVDNKVKNRFRLLKENKCKDIIEYANLKTQDKEPLHRHIIVVDEAAEMFLTNPLASPERVRTAKEILSKIARIGRSLGIHLVVATQRPDSRALDPQIKANLTGILCFQMVNDISSITVLGNGRATDLPPIPGRGIWKSNLEMVEIQTPYLPTDRAEELLAPYKTENHPEQTKGITPEKEREVGLTVESDL